MNKSSKLDVCQIVLCKQASLFAVGVYQMCEVEVLAEAHSGVGFVAQPCRSALRMCGTILCDTIRVDQVSQYL